MCHQGPRGKATTWQLSQTTLEEMHDLRPVTSKPDAVNSSFAEL
jgi:hypothetical protein